MKVPVGPFSYEVILTEQPLEFKGRRCMGLCDSEAQKIFIARRLCPQRRVSVFWHELAHAWKCDLEIHCDETMEEEPICNMIGLAMTAMEPYLLARLHVFLTQGIETEDVIFCLDTRRVIPVMRIESKAS